MGKKLSLLDIGVAIKSNPNTVQFETCCKCDGIEISDGTTMNDYGDPDTFEVICDECLNTVYILYQVKRDGNGVRDEHKGIAISKSKDNLVEYCKREFGLDIGEPTKFTWDDFYLIKPSKIKLI